MSSSQSSNQIHYTSKEAWEEYLNKLKELLSIVNGIRTLKNRLDRELKRSLSELADNESYLKLLFGGVIFEKGKITYLNRSLAKIVLNLFSVGFSVDELARIGNELEGGKELKKLNVVPQSYETTPFMKNVENLWVSLSNTLQIKNLNAREYGAENLSNALTDLINAMGPLLPTYNELSFFIYSLSGAPRFYINEEYPEFSKSDTFQPLDNFKITLETILRDPLGRDQFSIVGVKSGPGRSVIDSLNVMFNIFAILRQEGIYDGGDELYKYVKLYYNTARMSALGVDKDASRILNDFCGSWSRDVEIKNNGNILYHVHRDFYIEMPFDRYIVALAPAMFTHILEVNIGDTRSDRLWLDVKNRFTVNCEEILR